MPEQQPVKGGDNDVFATVLWNWSPYEQHNVQFPNESLPCLDKEGHVCEFDAFKGGVCSKKLPHPHQFVHLE